ncbi:MAG: MerR family transcriptional regulator [Chloroflexota bacterium]|nr:MerR family transcriptional regulator [Chloroflexota bacterium]MDE2942343.1 MerR family transcriptional regulator [Chloroflexota bacterium]MDE3268252.1 MerR family transcriptional regulator [Chloroflexota bacterium]
MTQEIGADPEEHLAPDSGGTRAELQRESTAQQPGSTGVPSPLGGVYVISVASRILNVHPQTLRKYERLGLVTPTRSIGMLRLYSAEDVLRVRLIRYMVNNLGMNLAGVEFALSLVNRIIDLRQRVEAMSSHEAPDRFVERELDEILRELGAVLPNSVPRV